MDNNKRWMNKNCANKEFIALRNDQMTNENALNFQFY